MSEEGLAADFHAGGMHVQRLGPGVSSGVSLNIGGNFGKELISKGCHVWG